MNTTTIVNLSYLLAAVLFISGLKGLGHPKTAVRGNLMGAAGMLLAIVTTLVSAEILSLPLILAGLLIGAFIGVVLALSIKMTAMPQLVGLFNGFGGLASAMVAGAVVFQVSRNIPEVAGGRPDLQFLIATAASGLIG
ncbi:MAG: NAD(P)(+) transhydrogenase (Re/Si-specific) subunit beta, partial [Spirochaetia bacterium]